MIAPGSRLDTRSSKQLFTSFKLEELYNQIESEIKLDLSSACMPALSLEDLVVIASTEEARQSRLRKTILDTVMNTKLSYSSQFGSEECRNAILQLYPASLEPRTSNFILTSGASEAIFLVMSTMFEKDDTIIVQQPIYQSLYQVAADRGVKLIDWNLSRRSEAKTDHWDLNELKDLIKKHPEAKALVINNPNNPTGLAFKEKELKQISLLLENRYLICDEVFLFISQSQIPSAINFHPNTIVISDLSKSFNMPGLRLGWILEYNDNNCHCEPQRGAAIQKKVINNCSSLKNYLSLRTNTLSEALAPYILDAAPQLCARNRALIKANIDTLYSQESEIFDLSQITKKSIEGLCIFPRIKNPDLIDKLWQKQGIFVATGDNFGESWGEYCRISLTLNPKIIDVSASL